MAKLIGYATVKNGICDRDAEHPIGQLAGRDRWVAVGQVVWQSSYL